MVHQLFNKGRKENALALKIQVNNISYTILEQRYRTQERILGFENAFHS